MDTIILFGVITAVVGTILVAIVHFTTKKRPQVHR